MFSSLANGKMASFGRAVFLTTSSFESTVGDGVFTMKLDRRLRQYMTDAKLGIRRLKVERTPEMLRSLNAFVEEVRGRPYKQNIGELWRAWQGNQARIRY